MKKNYGKLIDRMVRENRIFLRVVGRDVIVEPRHEAEAADLRGGDSVPYVYRGGRAFFAPAPSADDID